MLFTIAGKHISLTEDVRKYAQEKTAKLPRYYDSINQIEVIIDDAPNANTAVEIIARAEHSKVFVVKQIGGDVYQCIDSAVHKLEGQLRKKKEKERDNKRGGGSKQV